MVEYRVEQHQLGFKEEFSTLCKAAKNLYNQTLFYYRQSVFGKIQYFSESEIVSLYREFNDENFRALPSATAGQVVKNLFKNIKSWQKAKKAREKNPTNPKPKLPKYKKEEESIIYFSGSNQIRLKDGYIHFPKDSKLSPIKTNVNTAINEVRIIPRYDKKYVVEVVYSIEIAEPKPFNGKVMGIDLGVNNLAACVCATETMLINGKPAKSINAFYNETVSTLQEKLPKNQHTSKRIHRITNKRNNTISNYIHQAAKDIVAMAVRNDISIIVIGKNKFWKQEINLGKDTNRKFVMLPHAKLIEKIKYKAKAFGIEVEEQEESYTSKCSSIDNEEIRKHETYKGKRIKRGLFVSEKGFRVNADLNGAYNILRKYFHSKGMTFQVNEKMFQTKKIDTFKKK